MLAAGPGDTDNGSFTTSGGQLFTAATFDYEAQSNYSIRVRVTDAGGLSYEEPFTITITDENLAPTDLVLSASEVIENRAVGTVVGSFFAVDAEPPAPPFAYTLAAGPGDADNARFTIVDGELRTAAVFDYEAQSGYSIRVQVTDAGGLSREEAFTITVLDENLPPTAIMLSSPEVAENLASGTVVGTFSAVDGEPPAGAFTYTLAAGEGDMENATFAIVDGQLRTAAVFDYEAQSSYSIRVRVTDAGGLWWEEPFLITVLDVNLPPTDLMISATTVAENEIAGTPVGVLAAVDGEAPAAPFQYALAAGEGDTDNASFAIDAAGTLLTAASFDCETKSSYSVRLRTTDSGGLSFEKQFTITVSDVNEVPTDLSLAPTQVPENQPVGTVVGTLATLDPDAGDTHGYTLASGEGDTDNAGFTIDAGGNLLVAESFDFEAKSAYSIRVRTTDAGGLWLEKPVAVAVTNLNEPPTDLALAPDAVAEGQPAGTFVGLVAAIDPDAGDLFGYALVSGEGDADNAQFTIDAQGSLVTADPFDFETKPVYSIRVQVIDAGGLGFEKALTVAVTDVNEGPTELMLSPLAVAENQPAGTVVGQFATLDPDTGDRFAYTLVPGSGDADNDAFTIDSAGNLQTLISFDHETKPSYSIRVRTTDQGNLWLETAFTIAITNINEAPNGLTLIPESLPENQPAGTVVGTLSTADPDSGGSHVYSLVAGNGDGDNGAFTIDAAGRLIAARSFDYEARSSYSIRVRTSDNGGLWFERALTVTVTNVDDASVDTPGLYVPSNSVFFLNDQQSGGEAAHVFVYGVPGIGWVELVGDWDGDGVDTPGMYDPATSVFYLTNRLGGGDADQVFMFGIAGSGWKPLVGDWNGDGRDGIGVYEPATSLFFFKNAFASGDADEAVQFGVGSLGWYPVIGDWDGLPGDGFGFYEPATSLFFLKNAHTSGPAEEAFQFGVGSLGWIPLVGNWDRTPGDGVGFYVPSTAQFFLKNAHESGPADISFVYGIGGEGWRPLVGCWSTAPAVVGYRLPVADQREQASVPTPYSAAGPTHDSPLPAPSCAPGAVDQLDLAALAAQQLQPTLGGNDLDLLFGNQGGRRWRGGRR